MPSAPSMKMQQPSSGPTGRGQIVNRVSSSSLAGAPAEGAPSDTLIGRKVRTRWPDDNNFYEALITDYNAVEVCFFLHSSLLVYLALYGYRFNVQWIFLDCIFGFIFRADML